MISIQDITKSSYDNIPNWLTKHNFTNLTGSYLITNSQERNLLEIKKALKISEKAEQAFPDDPQKSALLDKQHREQLKDSPLTCVFSPFLTEGFASTVALENLFQNNLRLQEQNRYSFTFLDDGPEDFVQAKRPFTFPLTFALSKEVETYENTKVETLYVTYVDANILKKIIPNYDLLLYLFPEQITDLVLNTEKYKEYYEDIYKALINSEDEIAYGTDKYPLVKVFSENDKTTSVELYNLPYRPDIFKDFDLDENLEIDSFLKDSNKLLRLQKYMNKDALKQIIYRLNKQYDATEEELKDFRTGYLLQVLHNAYTTLTFSEMLFFPTSACFQSEVYNFMKETLNNTEDGTKIELMPFEDLRTIKALYKTFWKHTLDTGEIDSLPTDEFLSNILEDQSNFSDYLTQLSFDSIHPESKEYNEYLAYLFLQTKFNLYLSTLQSKEKEKNSAESRDQYVLSKSEQYNDKIQMISMEEMMIFLKDVCGEELFSKYIDERRKKVKLPKVREAAFAPYVTLPTVSRVSDKPLLQRESTEEFQQTDEKLTQVENIAEDGLNESLSANVNLKFTPSTTAYIHYVEDQKRLTEKIYKNWGSFSAALYFTRLSFEDFEKLEDERNEVEKNMIEIMSAFDNNNQLALEELLNDLSYAQKKSISTEYTVAKSNSSFSMKKFQEEFVKKLQNPDQIAVDQKDLVYAIDPPYQYDYLMNSESLAQYRVEELGISLPNSSRRTSR